MTVATPGTHSAPTSPLPELRAELQILGSDGQDDGGVIFDPFRQRYYRIDRQSAQLLALWPHCGTVEALTAAAVVRFDNPASLSDVERLKAFLIGNALVLPATEGDWQKLTNNQRAGQQHWLAWLMHNYLFLKIPLLKPMRALARLAPWFAPIYTRTFAGFIAGLGLVGLYCVSRQWDSFLATFPHVLTAEGAVLFATALVIVKSLHELGHAITAARYGCRVPSMGICFMLLVPMLYTDVSDAWRLKSLRRRIAIDAAGIAVETGIACCATFVWVFLPEGTPKSLAFALATTSWFLCLGLNLNPFMRFDGYYILSDFTGIENLQPRSFDFGVWKLREMLFGLRFAPPEMVTARQRRWLVLYAWSVWLYRAVLFTGIAFFVYHLAFKLLGIALFLIEIIYFLAGPVWREVREWYKMRAIIAARRRSWIVFGICSIMLVLSFLPLSTSITIPAILEDRSIEMVHPRRAARVIDIHVRHGEQVRAGQLIVALTSPELDQDIQQTRLRLKLIEKRLERRSGDPLELQQTPVLEFTRGSLLSKLEGLERERSELRVVAHQDAVVAEVDPHLVAGVWIKPSDRIAMLIGAREAVARGYLNEADVARIDMRRPATFTPETLNDPSRQVTLEHVAPAGADTMDLVELASHFGGGVAARPTQRPGAAREHVPVSGQFLVTGSVVSSGDSTSARVQRGSLHARGEPQSLAAKFWLQILKVLVRESGL